jgi:hypothetical protein
MLTKDILCKREVLNFVRNSSSQNINTPIGPRASLEATSKRNIG